MLMRGTGKSFLARRNIVFARIDGGERVEAGGIGNGMLGQSSRTVVQHNLRSNDDRTTGTVTRPLTLPCPPCAKADVAENNVSKAKPAYPRNLKASHELMAASLLVFLCVPLICGSRGDITHNRSAV